MTPTRQTGSPAGPLSVAAPYSRPPDVGGPRGIRGLRRGGLIDAAPFAAGPSDIAAGRPTGPVPPVARVPRDLVERVVEDLFAAGLSLTSCAGLTDDPVTGWLAVARDGIGQTISDLRAVLLDPSAGDADTPPGDEPVGGADLGLTVDLVRRTARHLDELAADRATPGSHTLELLEAAHRSHGAAQAIERARPAVDAARRLQRPDPTGSS